MKSLKLNKWDKLSNVFDTYIKKNQINSAVADNVEILWPLLFKIISSIKKHDVSVLDYGCGCGGFCEMLSSKGFKVTGIDMAKKMISRAKKNSSGKVTYYAGDINVLNAEDNNFNAITSMMVFQFIQDVSFYIQYFHKLLLKDGVVVIAVFNPKFVEKCKGSEQLFTKHNKLQINGTFIDTYIRSENEYKKLFSQSGFKLLCSSYPKFTKEFVRKYKWGLPSDVSEYLVMTFVKKE